MQDSITQLWVDLFCGAGGTSQGLHEAQSVDGQPVAKVVACINHDAKAIQSHKANFPDCLHSIEDIRTAHLQPIQNALSIERENYPFAKTCLWASLECTHFSKAKGGGERDADSRTLANHLFRYVEEIDPDFIYIENVYEFMSWGELDGNGKPLSKDKGRDYIRWIKKMCGYGYTYDYRLLNCADFGAPTTRVRYFGIFAKFGNDIQFPQPTHSKVAKIGSLFSSNLKPWRPVKECLDFSDEGNCIFERKKSLSERTMERIYAGLIKYVAGGKDAFIANYYSGNPEGKVTSIDLPLGAITTIPHASVVKAHFMPKFMSNNALTGINAGCDINKPCHTITTQGRLGLATAKFLMQNNFGSDGRVSSIDSPARTITASGGQLYKISAKHFLTKYYSGDGQVSSINTPSPTLRTKDTLSKISVNWIDKQYGTGGSHSVNVPSATITNTPKLNLVKARRWLLNPQYKSNGRGVEQPCFTLIARMDKMPPYLITAKNGQFSIRIEESDSEIVKKIKAFMAQFGIYQIKMRMLNVQELKLITGFPSDYVLCGNQADQKKFIGNAVPPAIARALSESVNESICFVHLKKNAA